MDPRSAEIGSSVAIDTWDRLQWTLTNRRFLKTAESTRREWGFRGLKSAGYELLSTLDRLYQRIGGPEESLVLPPQVRAAWPQWSEDQEGKRTALTRVVLEGALLTHFQRECAGWERLARLPESSSRLEWLALMRHFGAPVRFLDWTSSFWVALFFAVEDCDAEAAIWAIDLAQLRGAVRDLVPDVARRLRDDQFARQEATFAALTKGGVPFVIPVSPWQLNERMVRQQGLLLWPGDARGSFQENLRSSLSLLPEEERRRSVVKLVLSPDRAFRRECLARLWQMNITRATLFPDLGGFAASLAQLAVMPADLTECSA